MTAQARYAVIFSAQRTNDDDAGYAAAAARMEALCREMPGFVEMEHARSPGGAGITVCYWESEEAIAAWRAHPEHQAAQQKGAEDWYQDYSVRIAKVERSYGSKT